jgi:hypothetical protein
MASSQARLGFGRLEVVLASHYLFSRYYLLKLPSVPVETKFSLLATRSDQVRIIRRLKYYENTSNIRSVRLSNIVRGPCLERLSPEKLCYVVTSQLHSFVSINT